MNEQWKPIPGWEGYYEVSNLGNIRRTLYQRVREGRCQNLKPVRIGRSTRFPKAHIDALAEGTAA